MSSAHDVVIVGAGCAGLSLAVALVEAGCDRRVLLLDPRTDHGQDRTWCFFEGEEHPFTGAITHRWDRVAIGVDRRKIAVDVAAYPYAHLPSAAFYDAALERLRSVDTIELRLGCAVESIDDRADRVDVRAGGERLEAAVVFDSRPVPARSGLNQHFCGWFVETDADAFDPSTAMLMDFRVRQDRGIHFVYVLPFDARRALVEDTYFAGRGFGPEVYDAELSAYLTATGIGEHRITHRERGAIPMTTEAFEARPSKRVYRIGLGGGLARPATGYAFLAIQRHSRALAERLAVETLPEAPSVRDPRVLALDHIFLAYLERHPEEAPALFARLFERVRAESLARFLIERSSIADELAVMAALPRMAFTAHAIRSLPGVLRLAAQRLAAQGLRP